MQVTSACRNAGPAHLGDWPADQGPRSLCLTVHACGEPCPSGWGSECCHWPQSWTVPARHPDHRSRLQWVAHRSNGHASSSNSGADVRAGQQLQQSSSLQEVSRQHKHSSVLDSRYQGLHVRSKRLKQQNEAQGHSCLVPRPWQQVVSWDLSQTHQHEHACSCIKTHAHTCSNRAMQPSGTVTTVRPKSARMNARTAREQ